MEIPRDWILKQSPVRVLQLTRDPEELIEKSRATESRYQAWETVRNSRAQEVVGSVLTQAGSVFTGFEGFLYGICSPEAILEIEIAQGQNLLNTLAREIRYDYKRRKRVERTLFGGEPDFDSLDYLNGFFGAIRARMLAQVAMAPEHSKRENELFRQETYNLLTRHQVPEVIEYEPVDQEYVQRYAVPDGFRPPVPTAFSLNGKQEEAYQAVANVGRVAHPLVYALLHQRG